MRDIRLDEYHDLLIGNGDLVVCEGIVETAQALRIALLTCRYEWFLDGTLGVPWTDGMFWKSWTRAQKELEIKGQALSVEGIRSITRIVYGFDRTKKATLFKISAQSNLGPLTEDLGA